MAKMHLSKEILLVPFKYIMQKKKYLRVILSVQKPFLFTFENSIQQEMVQCKPRSAGI